MAFSFGSRARPASQQLFNRDRKIAHALAGRMAGSIRDRRRDGYGGQLAEAFTIYAFPARDGSFTLAMR
jgi:hypothetical protein